MNTKYQTVYHELKQMLIPLPDGEKLPPFTTLCRRYDISLATLNSALDLLEKDGLIRRVSKVGIFSMKQHSRPRQKHITLLMPGEHEPLFAAVISTCYHFCKKHNLHLSLEFSDLNPATECQNLEKILHDDTCDGLLFLPLYPLFDTQESLAMLKKVAEAKPVVQFDRELGSGITSFIGYDCLHDCYEAVRHLIRCGHRSIGLVRASNDDENHPSERLQAYFDALHDAGLSCNPRHTIIYDVHHPDFSNDAIEILSRRDCPTAYYCINSVYVPRFLRKARFIGKSVPQDFSLTCYDLADVFDNLPLKMTFMNEPTREAVTEALEQLCREMEYRASSPVVKKLRGVFIEGESCIPCETNFSIQNTEQETTGVMSV